jgi:tetratricopeptide (TPR) repeat protein
MRSLALATLIACMLATSTAEAIDPAVLEQAKALFVAGDKAYSAGNFPAAIRAFQEAYKKAPLPPLLFSMAQAYRRQYAIDRKPENLREAITHYRKYIEQVPQGGRRADAAAALTDLEVVAAQSGPADPAAQPAQPGAPAEAQSPTRVMISSTVKEAQISLDGGKPVATQLIEDVKPGKHKVRITAEGYVEAEQEVTAVEGNLAAFTIPLREKPARLSIDTPGGASVHVDGVLKASTPLSAPLAIAPGPHTIAIAKRGHETATRDLDLKRGENRTIQIKLHVTTQRIVSYILIGGGALGVAGGAVFTALAIRENAHAHDIEAERQKGGISSQRHDEYQAALEKRDNQRLIAGGLLGGGIAVAGAGLALYTFDVPVIPPPPPRQEEGPTKPSSPGEGFMEVSAAPIWSPGWSGVVVRGRF